MEKHIYNVCESRGEQRSRLWLEKARVAAAGFTLGKTYRKVWAADKLTLELVSSVEGLKRSEYGTVCGKKDRPIIDIVGAQVKAVFGKSAQYVATFSEGKIVLRPEGK